MKTEWLIVIGTIGGAAIGAITSLITVWISKSYERKNKIAELVFNAAIQEWKQRIEQISKSGGLMGSLDDFLLHMLKFSERVIDKKLSREELLKVLDDLYNEAIEIDAFRVKAYEKRIQGKS